MKKLVLSVAIAVLSCGAFAQKANGPLRTTRSFTQPTVPSTLFWSKDVTLSGDMTFHSKIGPVASSAYGFGSNVAVADVGGATIADIAPAAFGGPVSQKNAELVMGSWYTTQQSRFPAKVAAYLRASGIATAYFTYAQDLQVTPTVARPGVPAVKRKSLVWSGLIYSNGKSMAGAPRIVDGDPTFVQAIYWPLALDASLPTEWKYDQGGKIQWVLLNKRLEPLTTEAFIDVAGKYDNAALGNSTVGGVQSKYSGPVRCFIDKRYTDGGCTGTSTDVADLVAQTGSFGAIAVYVNVVTPTYAPVAPGAPDAAQYADPAMGYLYSDRLWLCDKLRNVGQYGYILRGGADAYYVTQSATGPMNMQLASSTSVKSLSPVANFTQEVAAYTLGTQHPDNVLISPVNNPTSGQPDLWLRNSQQWLDAIYIAPIRMEPAASTNLTMTPTAGTLPGGVTTSGSGNVRSNTFRRDGYGSGFHDDSWSFSVTDVSKVDVFRFTSIFDDDFGFVELNGHVLYAGPRGLQEINGFAVGETGFDMFFIDTPYTATCGGETTYDCSGVSHDLFSGNSVSYSEPNSCVVQTGTTISGGDTSVSTPVYGIVSNVGPGNQWLHLCPGAYVIGGGMNVGRPAGVNENHNDVVSRDVRAYLVNGTNVIRSKLWVAGGGGFGFTIDSSVQQCGSEFAIPIPEAPATPAPALPITIPVRLLPN